MYEGGSYAADGLHRVTSLGLRRGGGAREDHPASVEGGSDRDLHGSSARTAGTLQASSTTAPGQPDAETAQVVEWLAAYDRAFNAKDLQQLATFYHPDATIFEGGGVNNGWADYRDHHLGPELTTFENLEFAHRHVTVHLTGNAAYVTSEYTIKARVNGRDVDSGGLETLVLIRAGDVWKIRHSHTSARRR